MSEPENPGPPDPELEAFFADERARPPMSEAQRHAALGRVLAVPGPAPSGGISRGAAAAIASVALLLGGALGALGHAVLAPAPPPRVVEAPAMEAPRETVIVVPPVPTEAAPPTEPVVIETPEEAPDAGTTRPEEEASASSLPAEMTLVSRAQTALQRGLPESALSALEEHARRFPRGELAEEREALAVQALARAERMDEARRRAERFDARYPHSVLGPVVRAAVAP